MLTIKLLTYGIIFFINLNAALTEASVVYIPITSISLLISLFSFHLLRTPKKIQFKKFPLLREEVRKIKKKKTCMQDIFRGCGARILKNKFLNECKQIGIEELDRDHWRHRRCKRTSA